MKKITIVIGSNYGDEGKGRTVSYFSKMLRADETGCKKLVIRSNGGAQAGHTVVNNSRIVFSHFGSGTCEMARVPTYLSDKFIVNPMFFRKEYEKLERLGYEPKVYVHEDCLVTTVYDIFINQAWETSLGDKRYGSCGAGIYETILRNKSRDFQTKVSMIKNEQGRISSDFFKRVKDIRDNYFLQRLFIAMQKSEIPKPYDEIAKKNLLFPYMKDVLFFIRHVEILKKDKEKEFLDSFDNLIFEGAQGLLLDQSREILGENVTPSNTGLLNPFEVLDRNGYVDKVPVEVVYCTRWYMTRHGAGKLANTIKKDILSEKIEDKTNVPNEFQGSLRYGILDVDEFFARIFYDFDSLAYDRKNWKISVALNCLDQIDRSAPVYHKGFGCLKTKDELIDIFCDSLKYSAQKGRLYLGGGVSASMTIPREIVYQKIILK